MDKTFRKVNRSSVRKINFKFLSKFWRDPDFTPSEKHIVFNLILYAGTEGDPFPSETSLGRDMGITDRQVRNLLNKLHKRGLLRWVRRGFGRTNLYELIEEFYFRYEDNSVSTEGKLVSSNLGKSFPFDTGIHFPPNEEVSNEEPQKEETVLSVEEER